MQKRILPIAFIAVVLFSLINWNCTKLDTTDIGSDLIPAVDNVHTFDTVLNVISSQGVFNDSVFISKSEDYALGSINNDPLFGTTKANVFMQLKPPFYPFYFGNSGDTLVRLDSVVLCLKYRGFWGDSLKPIHLEVHEVTEDNFRDSVDLSNPTIYRPAVSPAILGTADVNVTTLGNYIKFSNGRDSVNYQVRIKLSPSAWATSLYNRDSIANNAVNNAFYSDSIYRHFYNGIAVLATGNSDNGLMYVSIADTATKIEIHYVKRNNGIQDSVYTSFRLNTDALNTISAVSNGTNNIVRNRAGRPVLSPASNEHYIQTTPGTYVNVNIPGLAALSNRIIHRAEVIVEQIPTDPILDPILTAPSFLYLDLIDTAAGKWKPIYFDLNTSQVYDPDYKSLLVPYIANPIDHPYFGGYLRTKADGFGNQISYYNFNVSRYVQQIVTKHLHNYDMRIYAPFNLHYGQYSTSYLPYGNNLAFGRVRVGSGTNPNYRLRLHIIYSKI